MPWEKSRHSLEEGVGVVCGGAFRFDVTEMTANFKWVIDARAQYVRNRARQAAESGLQAEKDK